jgi:hypothetical protein
MNIPKDSELFLLLVLQEIKIAYPNLGKMLAAVLK